MRKPWAIYAITKHGVDIGKALKEGLPDADLFVSEKFQVEGAKKLPLPFSPLLADMFPEYDCHIFIISVGAVVRMIAPHLKSKKVDPAVICIDDHAKFAICLLSGHVGRGNAFTDRIAKIIHAEPVITTASDVRGTLTVDILGRELGWTLDDPDRNVTRGCAAVVNEAPVFFLQETGEPHWWPLDKDLPPGVSFGDDISTVNPNEYDTLLIATDRILDDEFPQHVKESVIYRPKSLVVGIGCDRDTPFEILERGFLKTLQEAKLSLKSVKCLATIDIKKDEPGLLALAEHYNLPLTMFSPEDLDKVVDLPSPSETVKKHTGTRGVSEPAALLGAGAKELIVTKQKYKEPDQRFNMTMAVARIPFQKRQRERIVTC